VFVRTAAKLGTAALSALAIFGSTATAQAAAPGPDPSSSARGVHYPDVFAAAGYSRGAVDQKIQAAWQQLFHGDPGSDATHRDGRSIYYQVSPDMAYVEDIGNQDVRTEGMGYAMMIAVQLGHKHEFDSLWNFAKTHMQLTTGSTKYFFAWHTRTDGSVIDPGVAPDGDQWIAAALSFAAGRWGNGTGIYDYAPEARQILHAMWHEHESGGVDMFKSTTYLPLFTPPATSLDFTDPSYALPAFYKVFAVADPSDAELWQKAYDAGEKLLVDAHDPATGLAPCYSTWSGAPQPAPWSPGPDSYGSTFQEDAWRAIANANVDAAWWGAKPWQTAYSDTLETFFAGQGVSTYVSRYHLDGTPLANGQNTYEPAHAEGLVAMNSTSAITASSPQRTAFVRDFWNTPIPTGQARYYDGMLYLLGLLYDSGNFRVWGPVTGHPGSPAA
jgi:oligosaccharide reducing-end xylanase